MAEAGQQKGGRQNESSPDDLFLISRTSRAWTPWDCSWLRICRGRDRLGPAQHGGCWVAEAGGRPPGPGGPSAMHTHSLLFLSGPEPQTHTGTQSQRSAPGLASQAKGRPGAG